MSIESRLIYQREIVGGDMIPKVYLNPKLSLCERRRQLIAVLYERQSDTVGNLAFEFNVSSHTIRNDIRIRNLFQAGAGYGVAPR